MTKVKKQPPKPDTVVWRVDGPGGVKWSVWNHHDEELCVLDGPTVLANVVARVPPDVVRRMDPGHVRRHMESAVGSIHVAKLAGWDSPIFHLLWRPR